MKSVYIMTDLEGVAGVASFESQTYPTGKYYEDSKRLLTAEINAAVEGLIDTGVERIIVCDGHGPGGIRFEELHDRVELIHGRPITTNGLFDTADECDAVLIIGQHAMAGTADGNLNHTQSSTTIEYIQLNGRPIGEIAQFALWTGAADKPLIFLSGDEAACREAEALVPGITTAAVKKGLGRQSAISLSAPVARQRIREGATAAVRNHAGNPVAPVKWPPPYVLEKRFFHTDHADQAFTREGAERVDSRTVRFRGDRIRDIIYR